MVLPTPGPPVITSTLARSASRTAACWLAARVRPVRASTQGMALSASIAGQGRRPASRVRSRSAMPCSARYSPARNTQGRPSTVSATTSPASSSSASASSINAGGTSISLAVRSASSSAGRPQCPSSIASASA